MRTQLDIFFQTYARRLFQAIDSKDIKAIEQILQKDIDFSNIVDQSGNTPLHRLLLKIKDTQQADIVLNIASLLLDCGANLNIKNNAGDTSSVILSQVIVKFDEQEFKDIQG